MPITRSATKRQARLEDSTEDSQPVNHPAAGKQVKSTSSTSAPKAIHKPRTNISAKRKPSSSSPQLQPPPTTRPTKKPNQVPYTPPPSPSLIPVSRRPVLQLWAALLARLRHPTIPWTLCLSSGSSIAQHCANDKHRQPRTRKPSRPTHPVGADAQPQEATCKPFTVLGFPLDVRGDAVLSLSSGRLVTASQEALVAGFGGEERHKKVKGVLEEGIESWGDGEQLDRCAYRMYMRFRPDPVRKTKSGGRKGGLDLRRVEEVINGASWGSDWEEKNGWD